MGVTQTPHQNPTIMADIETASKIVYGSIVCLASFGITCNVLNVLVLTRRHLRSHSTYTYLTGLAASDALTLVFVLPLAFVRFLMLINVIHCLNRPHAVFEVYFFMPLSNTFSALSIWIASSVAFERFIFIRYPVTSKIYCKPKVACSVLAILTTSAALFHLPYFFTREIVPHNDNATLNNRTSEICYDVNYTEYSATGSYQAYRWIRMLFVQIVPWIVLLVCNLSLLHNFRKSRKMSRTNSNNTYSKAESRLTLMLIAIVFESLILDVSIALTDHVSSAVIFGGGDESFYNSDVYAKLTLTENFIETLSHSINFFLYCLLNKNFMREVQVLCSCGDVSKFAIFSTAEGTFATPRNSIDLRFMGSERRRRSSASAGGSIKSCR